MAASIGVESYVHGGPAQAFIDLHFEVLEDSIPASIGMFCYVNEFLCLKEFPPIERRCRQLFPSFDDRYFVENTRVDGTHVRRLEQCLLPLLDSEAELKVTLDACAQALDLRSSLYDSVLRLAYA